MTDRPIRAVLLDIDGTMLQSNQAHARAFVEAANDLGLTHPGVDSVLQLIGKGGDKLIPEAFGIDADSAVGRQLDARKGEIFENRYGSQLQPTDGARALVERLREDGYRIVVATSAGKEILNLLLDKADIGDLVDKCTTSSDVEDSKPDPDIVQAAVAESGYQRDEVVMIGDTPYDVEACRRAGVAIISLECGGWTARDLEGSIAVYPDPASLLGVYSQTVFGLRRPG